MCRPNTATFLPCTIAGPKINLLLLQLPAVQLEKALHKHPNLRPPLTAHSSQPNVRSTLPRSTLVVLGLAQDSQPADPSFPNQSMSDGNSVVPVSDTQVAESV
eukprot:c25576_g1_i1 orf=678-986(-)